MVKSLLIEVDDQSNKLKELSNTEFKKLKLVKVIYAAKIIKDKETGHSRGFGFVSIFSEEEALLAISKINGQYIENTRVCVKKAYDKKDLPRKIFFISKKWQEKADEKE